MVKFKLQGIDVKRNISYIKK